MKISVKQCCHSSSLKFRYEAGEGDNILLRNDDGTYFEATILTVKSANTLVVVISSGAKEIKKEISAKDIAVLMLGD